jgi:hypothetical protein
MANVAGDGTNVGRVQAGLDVEPEQRLKLADDDDDPGGEHVAGQARPRQELADEAEPEDEPGQAPSPDQQRRQRGEPDDVVRIAGQRYDRGGRHQRDGRLRPHVQMTARRNPVV